MRMIIKQVRFTVHPPDSLITHSCPYTFRVNIRTRKILFLSTAKKLLWTSLLYPRQYTHTHQQRTFTCTKSKLCHQPPNLLRGIVANIKLLGRRLSVSRVYKYTSNQPSDRNTALSALSAMRAIGSSKCEMKWTNAKTQWKTNPKNIQLHCRMCEGRRHSEQKKTHSLTHSNTSHTCTEMYNNYKSNHFQSSHSTLLWCWF